MLACSQPDDLYRAKRFELNDVRVRAEYIRQCKAILINLLIKGKIYNFEKPKQLFLADELAKLAERMHFKKRCWRYTLLFFTLLSLVSTIRLAHIRKTRPLAIFLIGDVVLGWKTNSAFKEAEYSYEQLSKGLYEIMNRVRSLEPNFIKAIPAIKRETIDNDVRILNFIRMGII